MTSYDRNLVNMAEWQQMVMNLQDKVDNLDRKSKTLTTLVEMLELRVQTYKVQIDAAKDEATLIKLTRAHGVATKHLSQYSAGAEECAIELMVTKLSFESERDACKQEMAATEAMYREAREVEAAAQKD